MSNNILYQAGSSFFSSVRENHKTHVANAYGKTIYARVTANKQLSLNEEFGLHASYKKVKGGLGYKRDLQHIIQTPGFTTITPRNYAIFHDAGDDGRVYVTAMTDDKDLFENKQVKNDCSIIVDETGTPKDTEYGSIWIDTTGEPHKQ